MSYLLYCIKGPFVGQEIPLMDVLIIGRDPSAVNLVIQDTAVSRAHVKLYLTQEGLMLEDLNSANGTFICADTGKMQAVTGTLLLSAGQRFSVGNNAQYIFEIRADGQQITEPSPTPLASESPRTRVVKPGPEPVKSGFNVDEDIFQTHTKIEITEDILATRTSRFLAYLIDEAIFLFILFLSFFLTGATVAVFQLIAMIFIGPIAIILNVAVTYVVFLAINFYFLNLTGQTIGKKVMKIYIADMNGRKAALPTIVGMRMVLMFLLTLIPFVGWIIGLANICFLFRQDRRMIHDLLANTVVLNCKNV